jgi:hypothetical protein
MNLRDLFLRARALAARRRAERELDEELAFHVECEIQKHLADGLSPAARGTAVLDDLVRDVLYACRTFRRARPHRSDLHAQGLSGRPSASQLTFFHGWNALSTPLRAGASGGKWRVRMSTIEVFSTQSMPCFV